MQLKNAQERFSSCVVSAFKRTSGSPAEAGHYMQSAKAARLLSAEKKNRDPDEMAYAVGGRAMEEIR
jgi:hypothetical protein